MISRSLGLEMGGAIGVPLLISQLLSVPLCVLGFTESLTAFFPHIPSLWLSLGTLAAITAITFTSVKMAMKAQLAIFFALMVSFVSFFLGGDIPAPTEPLAPVSSVPFWAIFAVFFPAATGIEAGVAMSGNLRDPKRSLPIGTISIIIFAWITYCAIAIFLSTHATPSALVSNPLIMQQIAKVGSLIFVGIWAATLSSSLGCLMSSARTLQALAKDGVFPKQLAIESGKLREPRYATLCCALISLCFIYFGTIDSILPILSMFLLIAYGTLNLATAAEEFMQQPSWRPTIRIPWIISLTGALLCFIAMLMINSGACMIALSFVVMIYLIMKRRNVPTSWDDIRESAYLFFSRLAIYRLSESTLTIRSWRPHFLVFSESPTQHSKLMHVTAAITSKRGFLTLATVFTGNHADLEQAQGWKVSLQDHLKKSDVHALVEFALSENVLSGARKFITSYGLGPLTPNTVVLGESSAEEEDSFKDYFEIIRLSLEQRKNVLIIREQEIPFKKNSAREVEIWWNEESKDTSYLMMMLSFMLQKHPKWKRAQVQLKSLVPTKLAQEQREEYFQEFLSSARLNITPKVYVADEPTYSTHSDLIFVGMRAPHEEESVAEYFTYYKELMQSTSRLKAVVLVISAERLELQDLFD
jgi:amino acid transporter